MRRDLSTQVCVNECRPGYLLLFVFGKGGNSRERVVSEVICEEASADSYATQQCFDSSTSPSVSRSVNLCDIYRMSLLPYGNRDIDDNTKA